MGDGKKVMRCKLRVTELDVAGIGQFRQAHLKMGAVWAGSNELQEQSENAVFGRNTPYGDFRATICNQQIIDDLKIGDEYYVDFVKVLP